MAASLYFIGLYSTLASTPVLLALIADTRSGGFFAAGTILEYLNFTARSIVQRTKRGSRQTLSLEKYPYAAHCYVRGDGFGAVAITRPDYPTRPIYALISKSIDDYEERYDGCWKTQSVDTPTAWVSLKNDFLAFDNVEAADKLLSIQAKIKETQDVTRITLDKLLQRGETIDSLVTRSQDLSDISKKYYTNSKKLNSCCWRWMGW